MVAFPTSYPRLHLSSIVPQDVTIRFGFAVMKNLYTTTAGSLPGTLNLTLSALHHTGTLVYIPRAIPCRIQYDISEFHRFTPLN